MSDIITPAWRARRRFLAGAGAASLLGLGAAGGAGWPPVGGRPRRAHSARTLKGGSDNTIVPTFAVRVLNKMGFGPARRVRGMLPAAAPDLVHASGFETLISPFAGRDDIAHFLSLGATDDERLVNYVEEQLDRTSTTRTSISASPPGAVVEARLGYSGGDRRRRWLGHPYRPAGAELQRRLRRQRPRPVRGGGSVYLDLEASGRANDLAVVIQTEFGRQIKENGDFGTDHGLGNPMVVIGGGVSGGLYRPFPGLAPGARIGDSVEPLTDFRRVHATVMDRLMGNPNVEQVFPGFSYTPIGFA